MKGRYKIILLLVIVGLVLGASVMATLAQKQTLIAGSGPEECKPCYMATDWCHPSWFNPYHCRANQYPGG